MKAFGACLIQMILPALMIISLVATPLQSQTGMDHQHTQAPVTNAYNVLSISKDLRQDIGMLITQDYQGRMKPIGTLALELVRKIVKRESYQGWEPLDLYLSWIANPQFWWQQPLIFVRHPGLKEMLGVSSDTRHVAPSILFDDQGKYLLRQAVEEAHRTPDRDRSKLQRKLIAFDERLNLIYLSLQGKSLRIFPIPNDPNNTWTNGNQIGEMIPEELHARYEAADKSFRLGIGEQNLIELQKGLTGINNLQREYGGDILPGPTALKAEMLLNKSRIFTRVVWVYFLDFILLMAIYIYGLVRRKGRPFALKHPFYALGMLVYTGSLLALLVGFVLRWIASGRAPLSNGFESLLFISLAVAFAGLIYEVRDRRGSVAGVSSLLSFVVLGISMMSFFDPAIGMLMPVLDSYWLIIHVTVITASYGFLGLGSILGGLILILFLAKGPGRRGVQESISRLDKILYKVILAGLGLLVVGTLLGGVWANESWGRYWGWDPKETWSLVTILVYAVILHFRFIASLRSPWLLAAGSFLGIASVIMTYFGVNYFLSGLHSYAAGGVARVPGWIYIASAIMITIVGVSFLFNKYCRWEKKTINA